MPSDCEEKKETLQGEGPGRFLLATPENPLLIEVERAFTILNHRLFHTLLVAPFFRLNLRRKAKVRFHQAGRFEMVLGYGVIEGSCEDFLGDLLHEMVHVQNWLNRVQDCTSNQYHNQYFKTAALGVGLYVVRHKTRGWVTTFHPSAYRFEVSPSRAELEAREEAIRILQFDESLFRSAQREIKVGLAHRDQKQFQYKYVCSCPPPHNSVRCGRRPDGAWPLEARCLKCNSSFVLDDVLAGLH